MATIQKRKNSDGSISYLAQVRIRPFKPTSKSFSKRVEAKAWADALETELQRQRKGNAVSADVTQLKVGELIQQFLDDPETEALRYYDSLSTLLAWWSNDCGGEKVLDFNVLRLREVRDKLRDGRAPATVNRYLSALRSCWNWGRASGLVPQDKHWPTRLMLKENNERQRYLDDDELTRLLDAAKAHSKTMHAAVVLSVACGLRQGELLRLKWSDVDLDANRIRIMQTKSDTPRTVYLPPVAAGALRALKREGVVSTEGIFLSNATGEPLNKGTIRLRWLEIRDAAGLKDFRWHDLRHSCASFLAQHGASLLQIGSVLGHTSPSTTKRYSHLVEGEPVTGHDALNEKLRGKLWRTGP